MGVLIILKTILVYIKDLFYLKGSGTGCAPQAALVLFLLSFKTILLK